nr:hypothetical protein [Candidatus Freyarchaeota archaeon]
MSKALLIGTVGGIIGTITAAVGIMWVISVNTLLNEIYNYLVELAPFVNTVISWIPTPLYTGPWPQPIFSSWPLFGLLSSILAMLLIVTGILIGIGFYGTYKIGGGAPGVVGLIFGIIGGIAGALLITIGNTTPGYMSAVAPFDEVYVPVISVTTPNFNFIWASFGVLALAFIIIGAASISVRETTNIPSASMAAGILSIIGAVAFLVGSIIHLIPPIVGFGLTLVSFILWAVVFYSSREM